MKRIRRKRELTPGPDGFTLVEVLITIGMIGLLLAMLVPAIVKSRESARRLACQNNLKQLILATSNYHDANRVFPLGCVTAPLATDKYVEDGYGWGVALLPYLEQRALYASIREPFLPDASGPQGTPGVFDLAFTDTGHILTGGDTNLKVFRCPTSILANHVRQSGVNYFDGYATADYKGSRGVNNDGIFLKVVNALAQGSPSIGFNDVTDGSSNTIAIGESAYYHTVQQQPVWVGAVVYDESCLFKTQRQQPSDCFITQKSLQSMLTASGDDCAFSWHHGGAYFVFVDGSVHFLSDHIDGNLYERLGSRDDGFAVSFE
jgi:prepilin-type N-terminal cleavage/methylation domain-containing protein